MCICTTMRGFTLCVSTRNVKLTLYFQILYPILVLSILASNCEWTGTNPAYTSVELSHHFSSSETRYVITDKMYLDVVTTAIALSGKSIEIIVFTDVLTVQPSPRDCTAHRTLHDLVAKGDGSRTWMTRSTISPTRPAALMCTSGTTGKPKMVSRSHRSLVVETRETQDADFEKTYAVRRLYCSPIFHAFSFAEMVINSLRLGHPSYFMRRFDNSFVDKIHKYQITETMGVPAMLLRITEQCEKEDAARLKLQSLQQIVCAGAALPDQVRTRFLRLFEKDSMRVVQVWGLTECGRIVREPKCGRQRACLTAST